MAPEVAATLPEPQATFLLGFLNMISLNKSLKGQDIRGLRFNSRPKEPQKPKP